MAFSFDSDGARAGSGRQWGWVLACGILLLVAGAAALGAPAVVTVSLSVFLGWLLLVVGVALVVMGFRTRRRHDRWSDIIHGAISILVGVILLADPIAGALSLTLGLAIWLALRGLVAIGGAIRSHGRLRGFLALTAAIDILLAILLIANFPYPAVQAVGLFVAISFLIGGATTIAAAIGLRRIEHALAP